MSSEKQPAMRVRHSAQVQRDPSFRATLRGVAVAMSFIVFWTVGAILAWLAIPLAKLSTRDPVLRRMRCQATVAWSFRRFGGGLAALGLFRRELRGTPIMGPSVLIANHPSILDVTAILGHIPKTCCVVSPRYMKSLFLAPMLRACGHVAGSDGTRSENARLLEECAERLRDGFSVLVFPEGTRSPLGGMHSFRRGAFEVARAADVPLIPLYLSCDPPALAKGMSVFRHPLTCPRLLVEVDAPLVVPASSKQACRDTELVFRRRLGFYDAVGAAGVELA